MHGSALTSHFLEYHLKTENVVSVISTEETWHWGYPVHSHKTLVKNYLVRSSAEVWVYREPETKSPAKETVHKPLHRLTLWAVISTTAFSGLKPTASLFTLPHLGFPGTEDAGKMKRNQGAPGGSDTAVQGLFSSLWPAPLWYSTSLLEQQILTNVLRAMWWGKGCFHWEEAKLIFPIWWYHY